MHFRRLAATLSAAAMLLGSASAVHARPVSPDADFLIAAHQGNLAQIEAGRIAAEKGNTAPVRDLGRKFAAYHSRFDVAVRLAATDLHVTLPARPNSEQRDLVQQYRTTSGAAFDTLFVGSQLIAHERAVKLARVVLDTGTAPVVEKVVTKALPVIQRHQRKLTEVQRTLPQR